MSSLHVICFIFMFVPIWCKDIKLSICSKWDIEEVVLLKNTIILEILISMETFTIPKLFFFFVISVIPETKSKFWVYRVFSMQTYVAHK